MFARLSTALLVTAVLVSTAAGTAGAMSNGQPVRAGSAPWFASIVFRDGASVDGTVAAGDRLARSHCGGALIDARTVLTAAHCVADPATIATAPLRSLPPNTFHVILGDRAVRDSRPPELTVSRIDIDPRFALVPNPSDPGNVDIAAAGNDLALLTLSRPVNTAPTIAISPAPSLPGTPVALYGHGLTPEGARSDPLLRGPLSVISTAECARQAFVDPVREGVICAQSSPGRPSVQAGFGDSGGPVVTEDPAGRARLVGIFSFGTETTRPLFTPGFNAATDVRVGALRWPVLRAHLHL